MPLQAIRKVAQSQNGVGAFILQCKQLNFHYCNFGGSSTGMKTFLTQDLPRFAKANPGIEIHVSPRPNHHPVIVGRYMNGNEKAICVRNMEPGQVLQKATLLKEASGKRAERDIKPVRSLNESVRGIWDPFHGPAQRL